MIVFSIGSNTLANSSCIFLLLAPTIRVNPKAIKTLPTVKVSRAAFQTKYEVNPPVITTVCANLYELYHRPIPNIISPIPIKVFVILEYVS